MVYFTVASQGSVPGAIKRAYIPSVDDGSNNIAAAVPLDIKYITSPDGIAVDWVGRCVCSNMVSLLQLHFYVILIGNKMVKSVGFNKSGFYCVSEACFMIGICSTYRNLYWADSRLKRLEVALLDGRYRKHLVSTELGHPSAVAVNPRLG